MYTNIDPPCAHKECIVKKRKERERSAGALSCACMGLFEYILRKRCISGQYIHPIRAGSEPDGGPTTSLHLKPLLYYHESFVKLVPKFGIVTSLRTNFAAEAQTNYVPLGITRRASSYRRKSLWKFAREESHWDAGIMDIVVIRALNALLTSGNHPWKSHG